MKLQQNDTHILAAACDGITTQFTFADGDVVRIRGDRSMLIPRGTPPQVPAIVDAPYDGDAPEPDCQPEVLVWPAPVPAHLAYLYPPAGWRHLTPGEAILATDRRICGTPVSASAVGCLAEWGDCDQFVRQRGDEVVPQTPSKASQPCLRCGDPLETPEARQTGICAQCWGPDDADEADEPCPVCGCMTQPSQLLRCPTCTTPFEA